MPQVKYWKFKESVAAKVMTGPDGSTIMQMEGEDQPFPGFPRGYILFGKLSKLKHEIKNQVFNESWALLEEGKSEAEVAQHVKEKLLNSVGEFLEPLRYEMIPENKMPVATRELWRALSVMEKSEPKLKLIKEMLCLILTEDDAYRMRLQWLTQVFRPRWWLDPVKLLEIALTELENAEVVGDMKAKQRLLKRILLAILKDEKILKLFKEFCKEVDWNKLKLTEADKYHFRGKYFKVDWLLFEY